MHLSYTHKLLGIACTLGVMTWACGTVGESASPTPAPTLAPTATPPVATPTRLPEPSPTDTPTAEG